MTAQTAANPPLQPWVPSTRTLLFLLVLLALATRLAFLMHSIDEPLSANLAMTVAHFKISHQQPPAPGQFFYVAITKGLNQLVHDELTALSLASALFSSLALIPLFFALRVVFGGNGRLALAGTVLTAFCYGFWLVGVRPVDDPVAAFFVYSTVCALLLGLDRARWFCVGMAAFAISLGIEARTLYFLAPLAAVMCVLAYRRHGRITCIAGVALFGVFLLGWLVPCVQNCGGWVQFKALCRAVHEPIFTAQNFHAHLGGAKFKIQARHDFVYLWGNPVLAAFMLLAAVLGLVPLWRMGTRAKLFFLFGLSTIFYVFFVPGSLSKYYIYTAPVLCASAAAGLFWLSERRFMERFATPALTLSGAVAVLTLASIAVTLPVAARVKNFRSPSQAAYEFLLRRHGGTLSGVDLLTDNQMASVSLNYYRTRGWFDYASDSDDSPQLVPFLRAKKPLYLLTSSINEGSEEHLYGLERFTWNPSLYNVLQSSSEPPSPADLYLCELKGTLPDEYQLRGNALQPMLLGKGTPRDGRLGSEAEIILPHDGSGAAVVQMDGFIPPEYGFYFPYKIAFELPGGGKAGEVTVAKPGPFSTAFTLEGLPPGPLMVLRLIPAEYCIPAQQVPGSTEDRRLSVWIKHLQCTSPDHPMRMKYADGWFDPESDKNGTWRWSNVDGAIDLVLGHGSALVLSGDFISLTAGNTVDVLVNGKVVATAETPEKSWSATQTLRVPLGPGVYHVVFHSRLAAVKPSPDDARALAFGVRSLRVVQE